MKTLILFTTRAPLVVVALLFASRMPVASGQLEPDSLPTPAPADEAEPLIDTPRPIENLFSLNPSEVAPLGAYLDAPDDLYHRLERLDAPLITSFPIAPDAAVELQVEKFHATGPWTTFVVASDDGEVQAEPPQVVLLRGSVRGRPDSWVFLGITPTGVNGFLHLDRDEDYVVAPERASRRPDGQTRPVIYRRQDPAAALTPSSPLRCDTPSFRVQRRADETAGVAAPAGPFEYRVADVALDADWEFRQLFASANDALAYMSLLTAVISSIFERDMQLKLVLVYVRVWNTSSDPYTVPTGTIPALDEFKAYWQANMGAVSRNIAHLLSARPLGGGFAELASVCNNALSYGVNGNLVGTFPYPLQNRDIWNWDIYVVAHEMGHSFGSVHTHCFDPPLDQCANDEADCYSGPRVCGPGTIMSYCHGCPGDVANIDLVFHPECATMIRSYIENQCPRVGRNPCYVDGDYLGGNEDGTAARPFNSVREGAHYVIPGGNVRIAADSYLETFPPTSPMNRAMILTTTGGTVRIGGN